MCLRDSSQVVSNQATSHRLLNRQATLEQILAVRGIERIPCFGELVAEPDVMHWRNSFTKVCSENQLGLVRRFSVIALHYLTPEEHARFCHITSVSQVVNDNEFLQGNETTLYGMQTGSAQLRVCTKIALAEVSTL